MLTIELNTTRTHKDVFCVIESQNRFPTTFYGTNRHTQRLDHWVLRREGIVSTDRKILSAYTQNLKK